MSFINFEVLDLKVSSYGELRTTVGLSGRGLGYGRAKKQEMSRKVSFCTGHLY